MNDLINVKQFVTMTRCLKLASDISADEYRVCFSFQQFCYYNVLCRFFYFFENASKSIEKYKMTTNNYINAIIVRYIA